MDEFFPKTCYIYGLLLTVEVPQLHMFLSCISSKYHIWCVKTSMTHLSLCVLLQLCPVSCGKLLSTQERYEFDWEFCIFL